MADAAEARGETNGLVVHLQAGHGALGHVQHDAAVLDGMRGHAHAGTGRGVVGLDLNATHHKGVRSGTVTAVANALHLGRTLASYEIVVHDDAGRRVCTARLTCMILDAH